MNDFGRRRLLAYALTATLLVSLAVAVTYFNYQFTADQPGGSDFIPRWLGTRLLMIRGLSPYSSEATLAIQQFFYGHPAPENADQLLFVYPLYSALLFAPFSAIAQYALARALWTTALQAATILSVVLGLRLVGWHPRPPMLALLIVFGLLWYPAGRAMINGNPAIIAALSLTAGLWAIRAGRDNLAGFLLAAATIKPQMVVLLLPLVALWALSAGRKRVVLSLSVSLLAFVLLATAIQPDWLTLNLGQVLSYPGYTPPGSPPEIFALWWGELGRWTGWLLAALLMGLLIWVWRLAWASKVDLFIWAALLTLTVTNLIGLRTATDNYVGLIAAVLFVLYSLERWHGPIGRILSPVATILLFGGLWFLFISTVSGDYQHPIMFFPVPLLLLAGLLGQTRFWLPGRRQSAPV